jgi:hypothetical protein
MATGQKIVASMAFRQLGSTDQAKIAYSTIQSRGDTGESAPP